MHVAQTAVHDHQSVGEGVLILDSGLNQPLVAQDWISQESLDQDPHTEGQQEQGERGRTQLDICPIYQTWPNPNK